MISKSDLFFVSVIFVLHIQLTSTCAPYFQTSEWKQKYADFKSRDASSAVCRDEFDTITRTTNIAGPALWKTLFSGTYYCSKTCKIQCVRNMTNPYLSRVLTPAFRLQNSGINAEDILIRCICVLSEKYTSNTKTCTSKEFSWKDFEDEYTSACLFKNTELTTLTSQSDYNLTTEWTNEKTHIDNISTTIEIEMTQNITLGTPPTPSVATEEPDIALNVNNNISSHVMIN